jgi:hypothetical protein
MSWTTDEGLHEGYLLPEFSDGQRGLAVTTGAVADDQVIVDIEYGDAPPSYVTRPAAEAVGWRVMCDCRTEHGSHLPESKRWTSELLVRVRSKELEDLAVGRIFAVDTDVPYVAERDDVDEAIRSLWWREHAGKADALSRVEGARARVLAATRELDDAVTSAHAAGASPEAIDRAAGIARRRQGGSGAGRRLQGVALRAARGL